MMVKYPAKFLISELEKLSIDELSELEDALWQDRQRVCNVMAIKKMREEEE